MLSRRSFFKFLGWGNFLAAAGLAFGPGLIRFLYPRVLFEPSAVFKAGFPGEYPPGTVSEKFKKDPYGVWIVRKEDGEFYALVAICTHLGCTPRWFASEINLNVLVTVVDLTAKGCTLKVPHRDPLSVCKLH